MCNSNSISGSGPHGTGKANSLSDIARLTAAPEIVESDAFLTEPEKKIWAKIREVRELQTRRIISLGDSCSAAARRANEAAAMYRTAHSLYHEALINPNLESDDFDLAREAAEKLDRLEREYFDALPVLKNALNRIDFELREAHRAGLI